MASVVGIVNSALIKLGADTIAALNEDSPEARAANARFEALRDEVLRAHPWNFALARAELARLVDAPAFGPAHQYQLPADCLRVMAMDGEEPFEIEGNRLLTDAESARALYVRRVADPNLFDAMFRETLALRLAADLAYKLVSSTTLAQQMMQIYREHLALARSADAQEGDGHRRIAAELWLDARR